MLFRCTVHSEDEPVSEVEEDIVDERQWHEEKNYEDPSVVYDDVLQPSVLQPRNGKQRRNSHEDQRTGWAIALQNFQTKHYAVRNASSILNFCKLSPSSVSSRLPPRRHSMTNTRDEICPER